MALVYAIIFVFNVWLCVRIKHLFFPIDGMGRFRFVCLSTTLFKLL
jgi:hypothetical protein